MYWVGAGPCYLVSHSLVSVREGRAQTGHLIVMMSPLRHWDDIMRRGDVNEHDDSGKSHRGNGRRRVRLLSRQV